MKILKVKKANDLIHQLGNELAPLYLWIDVKDKEIWCDTWTGGFGTMPASVFKNEVVWYRIPHLSVHDANALMKDILPLARRIAKGSSWNYETGKYSLNDDAHDADESIEEKINALREDGHVLSPLDAGDWLWDADMDYLKLSVATIEADARNDGYILLNTEEAIAEAKARLRGR